MIVVDNIFLVKNDKTLNEACHKCCQIEHLKQNYTLYLQYIYPSFYIYN